jgi:hypothetical protein
VILNGFLKREGKRLLLLFFCLSGAAVAANDGDETSSCKFSLKEEIPKNIKFTVQSGRIAFLCKSETFFLRGTVTRTLAWQLTGKIFETMAERLKAETLEKWPSGRLYKINGDKKSEQKTLICGYHTRDQYSIDLCSPEVGSKAVELIGGILKEFRSMPLDKSPLLKSAPLYAEKKVFSEENETREPALLALTMPPGYVEVTRRENRALFTDAAGLAEMEIFYEISDLPLDSELAHRVYRRSIAAFLAKQGPWRPEKENNVEQKDDTTCLVFSDKDKRLSNYCYTVTAVTQAGKKRYCRVAFVVAYLGEAVDRARLLTDQQTLMNSWAGILRRHSN